MTKSWPPADPLQPGRGFDALHVGSSRADVLALFGQPSGEHGDGRMLSYLGFGVMIRVDPMGRVTAVTIGPAFGKRDMVYPDIELPSGVEFGMLVPDVRERLGEPERHVSGEVAPGSGRKHHVIDWAGLRLTFDDQGRMTTITVHDGAAE